jgi:hypothetical protein
LVDVLGPFSSIDQERLLASTRKRLEHFDVLEVALYTKRAFERMVVGDRDAYFQPIVQVLQKAFLCERQEQIEIEGFANEGKEES